MAWENSILDISVEAAEDLSSDKYRYVVIDATSKKARRPDAANEKAIGILQNAPASGEAAAIRTDGFSKLVAAGQLAVNAMVTAEYVDAADAGKGLATTTGGDYVRGIVVEAAGAEDDLAVVRLVDFQVSTT